MWLATSMLKWIVAIATLLVGIGALLWQLPGDHSSYTVVSPTSDAGNTVVSPTFDAGSSTMASRSDAAPRRRRMLPADAQVAPPESQLDPKGEAFFARLDVAIPDEFRARLARCNRQGLDPDAKITLSYRLHIEAGVVSASDVKIKSSDLDDWQLEQCMVSEVRHASWKDPELPDFAEDNELFIRIRSLHKYLSADEQEETKARNQVDDSE